MRRPLALIGALRGCFSKIAVRVTCNAEDWGLAFGGHLTDHVVLVTGRRALSESEPIQFPPRAHSSRQRSDAGSAHDPGTITAFNRQELSTIMAVYGRKVAAGEWRDYALDMTREKAIFSVFRRSAEYPLYRIEKNPKLARKQGAYSVVSPTGLILKRGHDLARVLTVLDRGLHLVDCR
jgi:hypothetical protein